MGSVIVGIGYNYGVGKDAAAQALCRDLGFVRRGFADPLKELAILCDPLVTSSAGTANVNIGHGRLRWAVAGTGWDEAKQMFPEVRRFLQELGVGARTVLGEQVWIDALFQAISPFDRVVIPDVRFCNEAEAIRKHGGKLVRIMRPGHAGDLHVSERELDGWDDWDLIVDNSGTLIELEAAVVTAARKWVNDNDDR